MSERLKSRKKTRFLYEGGVQIGEEEEVWEPTIQEPAPEFVGISETQSLPHGQKPLEAGDWSIYKIYEKTCIWMLREKLGG